MTEENTFRKTTPVPTHDSAAGQSVSASTESTVDFAMLEPRDQLKTLLQAEMKDKPFSELSSVLFDHRGASIVGHILLDTFEEAGYSVDDVDAVGALAAAAVPTHQRISPSGRTTRNSASYEVWPLPKPVQPCRSCSTSSG